MILPKDGMLIRFLLAKPEEQYRTGVVKARGNRFVVEWEHGVTSRAFQRFGWDYEVSTDGKTWQKP